MHMSVRTEKKDFLLSFAIRIFSTGNPFYDHARKTIDD